jgi:Skp family chaperone for outer membrane proteins
MIPRSTDPKGKSYGRSFPFATGGEASATLSPTAKGSIDQNGAYMPKSPTMAPKSAAKAPTLTRSAADLDFDPVTPAAYEQQAMSKKFIDALSDDIDPTKALEDIRRLLVGPANQMHEARLEEVISILEESDRNHQATISSLEQRCGELAMMCERLLSSNEDAHGKIQSQSDYFSSELQKSGKMQQDKLSELFVMIDNKLQKMSTEMHQLVDTLAAKTSSDYQSLANDVISRVQQLSASTASNHDKMVSHMENRLAQADAASEQDKRQQLDVFAEGFADLADRFLALRKNP